MSGSPDSAHPQMSAAESQRLARKYQRDTARRRRRSHPAAEQSVVGKPDEERGQ